jgi:hypothetical protein
MLRTRGFRSILNAAARRKAGTPRQKNRWYAESIPHAEQLYEIYLKERADEEGETGQ